MYVVGYKCFEGVKNLEYIDYPCGGNEFDSMEEAIEYAWTLAKEELEDNFIEDEMHYKMCDEGGLPIICYCDKVITRYFVECKG